jgi:putative DNA primase/helicase
MTSLAEELKDETLPELNAQFSSAAPNETAISNGLTETDYTLEETILSYTELLKIELPERKMILPWLPEGGLGMIYAERGLGKTHFALSLAAAITHGRKFMKWEITHPCGVLYVDGEMSLNDVRQRLSDFSDSVPEQPLSILSHEWFFKRVEQDLSITDPSFQNKLLEMLDNNKSLRVLIFDNLSSLSRIREDKADDWRAYVLPFLIACRRRGVAVVLIHHTGKSGDQRGTGAREDHLDTSIRLERVADATVDQGCQFKVVFSKSRGCYGKDVDSFIATLSQQPNQTSCWEISSLEQSTKERLISLIADSGSISVTEAANELGISKGMVSRLKSELEKEGELQYSTGKKPMQLAVNREAKR